MRFLRPSILVICLLSLLMLAGCPSSVSIAKLNNESGRYVGREVAVHGRVVNSFGLLGSGAFEVDDGTGRIWVLSNGYGVAGNGVRVGVVGRFTSGATMGGRTFASAINQTQRPHF